MLKILLRILEFPFHRTGQRLEALAVRFDLSKTSRSLWLALVDAVNLDTVAGRSNVQIPAALRDGGSVKHSIGMRLSERRTSKQSEQMSAQCCCCYPKCGRRIRASLGHPQGL